MLSIERFPFLMSVRSIGSLASILALLFLLSACGSDGPDREAASTSGDSAAAPSGDAGTSTGDLPGDTTAAIDPRSPDSAGAPTPATGDTAKRTLPPVTGRVFNVKSGVVELQSTSMGDLRQTLYFDDYGMKQAIHATMATQGMTSRSVTIMANGESVTFDPDRKAGSRVDLDDALAQLGTGGIPNLSRLTDEAKRNLKYQPIAGRTLLGRKADGASIEVFDNPVKIWSWEGVPMRMEASMRGQTVVVEATSLKVDVPVAADRFIVPSDVQIKDLGGSM
jgi:hypothetical protein